jgi:hypothetical protein
MALLCAQYLQQIALIADRQHYVEVCQTRQQPITTRHAGGLPTGQIFDGAVQHPLAARSPPTRSRQGIAKVHRFSRQFIPHLLPVAARHGAQAFHGPGGHGGGRRFDCLGFDCAAFAPGGRQQAREGVGGCQGGFFGKVRVVFRHHRV